MFDRSSLVGSEMRREPGCPPLQINGQARDGGAAQCDSQPVSEVAELLHSESSGPVPHFKGGGHISPGEGCGQATRGFGKSREGAEGGADCTMDGNVERSRLGKERQMPYGCVVWSGVIKAKDLSILIDYMRRICLV